MDSVGGVLRKLIESQLEVLGTCGPSPVNCPPGQVGELGPYLVRGVLESATMQPPPRSRAYAANDNTYMYSSAEANSRFDAHASMRCTSIGTLALYAWRSYIGFISHSSRSLNNAGWFAT